MSTTQIDILLKTTTLLHRENELMVSSEDSSRDLARTIIATMVTNSKNNQMIGGASIITDDLKYLIQDMIDNPDGYDKDSLLASLEVILKDKPELIKVANKVINIDMSGPSLKRTVLTLRNRLYNYHKECELKKIISKASFAINTNNLGDNSLIDFVKALSVDIETLTLTSNKSKDPAVINEFDINSEEDVIKLFDKVSGSNSEDSLLKTAWPKLNTMLQGGFRRGATVDILALQHNYKSGFVRTMLAQIAKCNIPILKDPTKKPLLIYISFEDDSEITIEFLYKYLYYSENKELPEMCKVSPSNAASYVKEKLGIRGYNVKLLRVNPSEWAYKNIFNKVLQYEADGYEVHAVIVDYLSKLPTIGCLQGSTGTDIRDMFNRVRNYFSARDILFMTPHQLSTEAKQLIRNGIDPLNFVKEITGKGYTEGSKQLDQVVDLELYLHKAKLNGRWVLTIQRGKDRRPTIVDDDLLYMTVPFPSKAPIPEDVADLDVSSDDSPINIDNL